MTDPVTTETTLAQAVGAAISARNVAVTAKNDAVDAKVETEALVEIARGLKNNASDAAASAATALSGVDAAIATALDGAVASATAEINADLADFRSRYLGPFNSTPTYVGDTAPWSIGALYWNRLQGKFYVWSGSAWGATDATTIAAASAASDSAIAAAASAATAADSAAAAAVSKTATDVNAAATAADRASVHADKLSADADAATATTQAGVATTKAAEAAASKTAADADAAATAADRTAVHSDKLAADADAAATAADRVQTGLDRSSTTASAAAASTSASNAAASKTGADSAAAAAAGSATAAGNSKAAVDASLLQSISYAALAQAGAASVSAATGLSILGAAQRAIALMTDGSVDFIYDCRRDSDGGASVDKMVNSLTQETLNTATRGATAKWPKMALLVGRNAASGGACFTVYDLTDQTVPMFAVWNGANGLSLPPAATYNLTSISAVNGVIALGFSGAGLTIIDLISEVTRNYTTAGMNVYACNLAGRNAATTYTLLSGAIASNTVYSVAMTIAPNTPLNPLRCNLPNPTVAVGHNSGSSVIRWDGVATSSSPAAVCEAVCFDKWGTLYQARFSANVIYYAQNWQTASYGSTGLVLSLPTTLGLTYKNMTIAGGDTLVIAATGGLVRIKIDPTNPANSLINVKTTTYDTGWMVLGKTVLAMAESSADVSTFNGAEIASPASGWTDASTWNQGQNTTLTASGGNIVATAVAGAVQTWFGYGFTAIVGKTYRISVTTAKSANGVNLMFGAVAPGVNSGWVNGTVSVNASGQTQYSMSFTATNTNTYLLLQWAGLPTAGDSVTVSAISIKQAARDVSGSGNSPVVVGNPPRGAVATGADTGYVSFGGSAGNGLENPGSIFDPATGDFTIIDWVNLGSTGNQVYRSYANAGLTGTHISVFSWAGAAYFSVFDGSTTYAANAGTIANVGWQLVTAIKRGTKIELYVGPTKVASATCSANSLTNGTATWRLGSRQDGGYVPDASSKFALSRIFNYAIMPDQVAFIYNDEKARFAANAQSLLTGANVQGVAWCPDTDTYGAPNSTAGCDVFKGSVRVANDNSATGSTNLMKDAGIPSNWGFSFASLGSKVTGPSEWGGGVAWQLLDTTGNAQHNVQVSVTFPAGVVTRAIPVKADALGYATVWLGDSYNAKINLATGAVVSTNATQASTVALSNGFWLVALTATMTAGARTDYGPQPGTSSSTTYAGTGGSAIQFGKTMLIAGSYTAAQMVALYQDALSGSANAKAAAFAGGKLAVVTAAGVDVWIPSADGLRAINDAVGAAKRPFYDPTWGQYFGVTTDATPTVFASIPIPEGKAFRFRATVVAVMYGGTATEKAVYDITGVVSRDIGGNVVVVSTTTTISEVTSSMDCIAQANTTAQTLEIKATGKAATRIAWFDGQELYDVGLMAAA